MRYLCRGQGSVRNNGGRKVGEPRRLPGGGLATAVPCCGDVLLTPLVLVRGDKYFIVKGLLLSTGITQGGVAVTS